MGDLPSVRHLLSYSEHESDVHPQRPGIHVPRISYPHGKTIPIYVTNTIESLKQCEKRMERLEQQLREERQAYDTLQKVLAVHRGRFAPVSCLPVEVLANIFMQLVQDEISTLATLSLVCRKWRQIIISNPLLWRRIVVTSDGDTSKVQNICEYVKLSVQRSEPALLDITIDFGSLMSPREYFRDRFPNAFEELDTSVYTNSIYWEEDECPIERQYNSLLTQLVESIVGPDCIHMSRWRSLLLTLPNEDTHIAFILELWPLFEGEASNLTELIVDGGYEERTDFRRLDRSFHELKSLQRLTIPEHFALTSFDVEPNSIRYLSIYEVDDWTNLLQFSSFSNLQSLRYSVLDIRKPTSIGSVVRAISLPHLHTLYLDGTHRTDILRLFHLPKLKVLYLLEMFGFSITPPATPVIPFLARVPDIRITSFEISDTLVDLFLHLQAVSSITVRKGMLEEFLEEVDCSRSQHETCLPNLQKAYPGDMTGERNGDPVDIPPCASTSQTSYTF